MSEAAKDAKEQFRKEKTSAMKARQVRIANWSDNERLYNGQPLVNLITRANLHVPKVFEGVQMMSSKIGELPKTEYDISPEGDENAPELMEALFNEDVYRSGGETLWQNSKTEGGIYGRPVFKIIPRKDGASIELTDTMAFLINPTATSHRNMLYGGQQFIFKTLDQIEDDADRMGYDKAEITKMKNDGAGTEVNPSSSSERSIRDLRLAYLGYANVSELGAKMFELTEWFTHIDGKPFMLTMANDKYLLRQMPLAEAGLPRSPWVTYAFYPRGVAFWTPGVADILRDPNLAIDLSINQAFDNNTYRNFGMIFVSSQSGLKQSSIVPRPLGVTAVNTGDKAVKDVVWQFTPPEITEPIQMVNVVSNLAERAAGLSAAPVNPKAKQSATQMAEQQALIESRSNLIKQNAIEGWQDMAQLYADTIKLCMTTPRDVKVYGYNQLTVEGVSKKNFSDVKFIAKATGAEIGKENKAIKQKAKIELYQLFKDDPLIPGQKFLRENVAKEFDLKPEEINRLFSQDLEQQDLAAIQAKMQQEQGGDMKPPPNPSLSNTATTAAATVPPAIR